MKDYDKELETIIRDKLSLIKFGEAYKWLFDTDKEKVDSWAMDIVKIVSRELAQAKLNGAIEELEKAKLHRAELLVTSNSGAWSIENRLATLKEERSKL